MKQLDDGKELHDINIDLKLSKLKPFHAEWLVELYNQMSTAEVQKIIHSAWKASGITEAMKAGKASLQPLDPFHDIDPMVELDDESIDFNLREVCNLKVPQLATDALTRMRILTNHPVNLNLNMSQQMTLSETCLTQY